MLKREVICNACRVVGIAFVSTISSLRLVKKAETLDISQSCRRPRPAMKIAMALQPLVWSWQPLYTHLQLPNPIYGRYNSLDVESACCKAST
jgi:hypothetical protein